MPYNQHKVPGSGGPGGGRASVLEQIVVVRQGCSGGQQTCGSSGMPCGDGLFTGVSAEFVFVLTISL